MGSGDRRPVRAGGDARGQSGDRSGERNARLVFLLRRGVLTILLESLPRTDRLSDRTRVT